MSDDRVKRGAAVQSVDRAVSILQVLARDGAAQVTKIAVELGVHKSTVSRLLSTLESRGLVEQDGERGEYRLGDGLLRLADSTGRRYRGAVEPPITEERVPAADLP